MTEPTFPKSLILVGAGKMGRAMLEGWLRLGLAPERVVAIDPKIASEARAELAGMGVTVVANAAELTPPEVMVLAIKPQMLDEAAPMIAPIVGRRTLLISVLAGKTIADLASRLPAEAIVRAMPNTPAAVGRGISAAYANAGTTPGERALTNALLKAVGRVEWIDDESLIDCVTAVSGSGPAYIFHMVEALAKAGAEVGLPPDLALRLARATVEGAGELLYRQPEVSAATLRENVTSPAGTTAAALTVLMGENGLTPLMVKAVAAAKRRAEELAG